MYGERRGRPRGHRKEAKPRPQPEHVSKAVMEIARALDKLASPRQSNVLADLEGIRDLLRVSVDLQDKLFLEAREQVSLEQIGEIFGVTKQSIFTHLLLVEKRQEPSSSLRNNPPDFGR